MKSKLDMESVQEVVGLEPYSHVRNNCSNTTIASSVFMQVYISWLDFDFAVQMANTLFEFIEDKYEISS